MDKLPTNKSEAFEHGVLTRAEGYCEYFNPFRNKNNPELYDEWFNGWSYQNTLMNE